MLNKWFDTSLYREPQVFRVNEMEDHAYFVPFENPDNARNFREKSRFFYSLNGKWKFLWKPSVYEMEEFISEGYSFDQFTEVTVPECWQLHGADRAQYQALPYPNSSSYDSDTCFSRWKRQNHESFC